MRDERDCVEALLSEEFEECDYRYDQQNKDWLFNSAII